ncbi:MAG TPA: Gfo/Idh/MocA family oxidoreductase [Acetobacteraceae bacterium]|nr:Gfo/Idh/MocA family oxidoreductase [Acetobacteraceae bacterium]
MLHSGDDPVIATLGRQLRLGVVGGAPGAMIAPMHRRASVLDGRFAIVAGVLSSDPARSVAAGIEIGLAPDRAYGSVAHMVDAETSRADGIDAVAIMTPNDSHYAIAAAATDRNLDVIIDKPLVNLAAEATELLHRVRRAGTVLCVTHPYSAYPMIREARALIEAGALGEIRAIEVRYLAGGLAAPIDGTAEGKRRWRLDPARSGPSLVLGDLGTHAHHLAAFVLNAPVSAVRAELATLVRGRRVHDYAELALRFASGARGRVGLCQAAPGQPNNLSLSVIGERASLEWRHDRHAELSLLPLADPPQRLLAGAPYLSPAARAASRLARTGHPDGMLEAFANLYSEAALAIAARRAGKPPDQDALFPTVLDGARGIWFIQAAIASDRSEHRWEPCPADA